MLSVCHMPWVDDAHLESDLLFAGSRSCEQHLGLRVLMSPHTECL